MLPARVWADRVETAVIWVAGERHITLGRCYITSVGSGVSGRAAGPGAGRISCPSGYAHGSGGVDCDSPRRNP